jgi:type IV pilus assembly protein PilE
MNKLRHTGRKEGFTLLELMISVAIIAVLAGIGVPLYTGYIDNSREAKLINNIATVEVFQERQRLRTGAYATGLANVAAIKAAIDWEPQSNDGTTYAIAANGTSYDITATDTAGRAVCMTYPEKTRC